MSDHATLADEMEAAVTLLRPSSPSVAEHTVAVRLHSDVVAALADWLDAEAGHLANDDFPGIHAHALAVARAVLTHPTPDKEQP